MGRPAGPRNGRRRCRSKSSPTLAIAPHPRFVHMRPGTPPVGLTADRSGQARTPGGVRAPGNAGRAAGGRPDSRPQADKGQRPDGRLGPDCVAPDPSVGRRLPPKSATVRFHHGYQILPATAQRPIGRRSGRGSRPSRLWLFGPRRRVDHAHRTRHTCSARRSQSGNGHATRRPPRSAPARWPAVPCDRPSLACRARGGYVPELGRRR